MTALRPMQAQAYPDYVDAAIRGYAHDNVEAGRWPAVGALQRSGEEFRSLLPQGLDTPDNHLFEILENEAGAVVGFVWYAIERKHGACAAYVYDLEIKVEYRRQGHALRALQALEAQAAASGAGSIGLNVFADNVAAQSLYRRLGYAPTNINMYKAVAKPYA